MDRFRSRRLTGLFFICVAVLGACKKDDSQGGGGGGGGAAASAKDLDMIPVDSDVVFGVDLAAARQSKAVSENVLPLLTKSASAQQVIELLKTKCKIDPIAAISSLTAGIKMKGRNGEVVAVVHGVEKSKALPCIDQLKEELAAQQLTATRDGDTVEIKNDRGSLAFTFINDTTAVVATGPQDVKARALEAAQGKSALKSSKEFNDMYSRVKTGHTLWFLIRGDAEGLAKMLDRLSVKAKAIYGSVNATDGLELDAKVRTETDEQATNLAALIKSQSEMAAAMVEKVDISSDKSDVKIQVALTASQVKSLLVLGMR
jgi:hypothetical protein